ncbi:MAG: helix-turn-helix transcriptional regulator [Phycisphaerae bacterium]|jgi:transcriptional regulator with XRE-family HTH domain
MPGKREFGNKIRKLRDAKKAIDPKFSLRQFALAVGISATYLSRIENGDFDPPAPETIKKIAALLGTDADELLALAGKTDPALQKIIMEKPKMMADFLRKASGISEKDLKKIIKDLPDKKD